MLSVRDAWKVIYASRALMMSGVATGGPRRAMAATLAGDSEPARASLLAAVVDRLPALWNWPRADIPGLLVHSRGTSQWLEAVGRESVLRNPVLRPSSGPPWSPAMRWSSTPTG